MVEAGLFISIVIVAITQLIKQASPKVAGFVTVIVAFIIGIAVSLLSYVPAFGLEHVSIAAGIISALGAIGISALAGKAGGGANGDQVVR